jgi:hypothetical protein
VSFVLPDPGAPNADFERPSDRGRLEQTVAALDARGFRAEIAPDSADARRRVVEAIPEGAEVHIALSETIRELGLTAEIDESGRYDSVRARLNALDRETQDRERRKLGAGGHGAAQRISGVAHPQAAAPARAAVPGRGGHVRPRAERRFHGGPRLARVDAANAARQSDRSIRIGMTGA